MKLQGSRPSGREILQSQIGQSSKNRPALNRLAVIHGRLTHRGTSSAYATLAITAAKQKGAP